MYLINNKYSKIFSLSLLEFNYISVFKLIIDIFLDNKNNYYVSFQKEIFIQPRESDLRIR